MGGKALRNVALATTKWGLVDAQDSKIQQREKQLQDAFAEAFGTKNDRMRFDQNQRRSHGHRKGP